MSYYYLTNDGKIYKSAGARKVRLIHQNVFNEKYYSHFSINHSKPNTNANSVIYTPYIPLQITKIALQNISSIPSSLFSPKWRIEAQQDLVFMHGIDITSELNALRVKNRNNLPIQLFKKSNIIIRESNDFQEILFELSMREL